MKKFNDLVFTPHSIFPGIHTILNFDNGYGVSVIRNTHSYGSENGLYEMAIIKGNKVCYDSGITNDVLGNLTENDVTKYMELVQKLPRQNLLSDSIN